MPANAHTGGVKQNDPSRRAVGFLHLAVEHPVVAASFAWYCGKVLVGDPTSRFIWVSAHAPPPQGLEDSVIDLVEGVLGADMPVIDSPAFNLKVELHHQMARRCRFVSLHDFSDIGEESRHVRFGRRNN